MERRPRARLALLGLGTLVAAAFLALALRRADLAEAWQALLGVEARYLPLLFGLGVIVFLLRPWRWQLLFPPGHRPGFRRSFGALTIGLMMNNLLPGRGGDLVRCFLVRGRDRERGTSLALATVVLEKLVDGMALLAVVAASFVFVAPPVWLQRMGIFAAVTLILATLFFVLLHHRQAWLSEGVGRLLRGRRLEPLGARVSALIAWFSRGLSALASLRQLLWTALITALIWVIEALFVLSAATALGVELTLAQAVTVTAILGLGLMIPLAPGYVGTYQFFTIASLGLFGVGGSVALAVSVLMHAWVLLATTLAGLAGLITAGLRPSEVLGGQAPEALHRSPEPPTASTTRRSGG